MKNEQGFLEAFKHLYPSCEIADDLVHEIFKQFPENDLDKLHRLSHFLGQCAHETLSFTRFTENLNCMSEEQKMAAKIRMQKYWESKNS